MPKMEIEFKKGDKEVPHQQSPGHENLLASMEDLSKVPAKGYLLHNEW